MSRDQAYDVSQFEEAAAFARSRIDDNIEPFADVYPEPSGGGTLTFDTTDSVHPWTTAFWPGQCWLAYEQTGEERFREAGASCLADYREYVDDPGESPDHDLGFQFTLAALAHYDVTGSEEALQTALRAADRLADRFHPGPGIIQAWSEIGPVEYGTASEREEWNYGRIIVDTMMNLPLLYRASELTGYERYREIAAAHARRNAEDVVREDGSTPHTVKFDTETGEVLDVETHQGYGDDSCWARGQAWTVYGFPLSYRHTGDEQFLDAAKQVTEYYIDNLPEDHVPRWDFEAPEGEPRDSSAGAIAVCGLFELASHLPRADPDRRRYEDVALATLSSLADEYTTEGADSNGILAEGAYNRPDGNFDEVTSWGDYFYVEGLTRAIQDWVPYW